MEMNDQFCCACLNIPKASKAKTLSNIYDMDNGLTYADCIKLCTNVEFNEGYYLCDSCILELQTSYGFHKRVISSQGILKELERNTSLDNIIDDILVVSSQDEKVEETIEVEALDIDYELKETLDCVESAEEESNSLPGEVQAVSDSEENLCGEVAKMPDIIENEAESADIVENCETNSSDFNMFQKIEIMPAEIRILHGEVSPKQKTITEKQRKRFFGKFCCDYCDKLFPNHSRMIVHRRSHEPDRPKFACNDCGRIYSTNQALEVHIRGAHKMSGYACEVCAKIFSSQSSLTVHLRFHTGNFPYICETCGHKFAQLCHLNTHRKVKHNSVRFCCNHPKCGKFFTSTASLRNHEFSHGIMPFECDFCHRGYPAKSKLKVHVRKVHKKDLSLDELEHMRRFHVMRSKPNIIRVEVSSSLENANSKDYKLTSKQKTTKNEKSNRSQRSEIIKFDFLNENKDVQLPKNAIETVIKSKTQREILSKVKKSQLTKARAPKAIGPPFICEQCGQEFQTRSLLISHRHRKHTLKLHQNHCEKCNKAFDARQQLEKHLKRLMCETYPKINCEYCSKVFIGHANYKVHLRFHTKEYNFICHLCAKSFMLAEHLNNHIKTKHENLRFECEYSNCGKQFQMRHCLKTHMYTHLSRMPYSCRHCERMLPTKGRLRWHIARTHKLVVSLSDMDEMRVCDEVLSIKSQLKATK